VYKLRVLVVDDSAHYRKLLSEVMGEIPDVEVIGVAPNGKIALDKIAALQPDLVSLDTHMPVMSGMETLHRLKREESPPMVIMVSSTTTDGARVTMEALNLAAFDYITKPDGKGPEETRRDLLMQFKPVFAAARVHANVEKGKIIGDKSRGISSRVSGSGMDEGAIDRMRRIASYVPPDIVAIAISTGGPKALAQVIPKLPGNLRVPIVIVQHILTKFSWELAKSLDKKSALTVKEAADGQLIMPGTVYIAPGGRQMKVSAGPHGNGNFLKITNDPPENNCKPSADYLMRSVASVYGSRALGIIMTGMGADGVKGLQEMKQHGVTVIAQDEESCTVYGMPAEAIKAGVVDIQASLEMIADEIISRVAGK